MKIKILNKNLQNPSNYNSAKSYEVDEAPVFTDLYNETLDSASIVISNQLSKIDIEPYDIVSVFDDDDDFIKYMCVDTYTEIMECVNPKIYKYEISLFSETKQLEGIVLPNLKISSLRNMTPRTVYYYIQQYMSEYQPYIRLAEGNSYRYREKWTYDWTGTTQHPSIQDKFNVTCPEMQWNTPTLREVLNDLMMVVDCIPILKNGKLDYLDLTKTKNNVTEDSHINYITRSRSSEDYVSELQMKLENVANNIEGSNNLVTKIEYVTLNIPDNDIVLTTNNMRLETQYPIYNLKSVKMMFPGGIRGQSPSTYVPEKGWVMADLMDIYWEGDSVNLIYEKNEWLTKNVLYNTLYPKDLRNWPKYQNSTFYYTRGGKEIENFNNTVKFLITTQSLYQKLCQLLCQQVWPDYDFSVDNYEGIYPSYYNLMFKIEYETLEGCLFRASKNTGVNNERVIIDNQTNSYVDSFSQGFLEYQKANRLGNEQLQINARYNVNETTMNIGDVYEDCVIYQVQKQYFKNHIEVNAIATKNYVLREYFTGVKSKIRSWKIVSGSEALVRHDLEKYYCEFSWNQHLETQGLGQLATKNVPLYLVSPIYEYDAAPLKVAFVRTIDDDVNPHPEDMNINNVSPQDSYYSMDLMTRIVGNSLVLTFEFLDNYWAGQSIHTENDYNGNAPTHGTGEDKEIYVRRSDIKANDNSVHGPTIDNASITGGGVPMYQHRYTDDNGEFFELDVYFATHCKIVPTFHLINEDQELYINDIEAGQTWYDDGFTQESQYSIYYLYQRPRVFESNFKWSGEHTYDTSKISVVSHHYKDSQEITNLSTQFEFCSDTSDILIGKEWLKNQQAINEEAYDVSGLKAIFYNSSEFNVRNPNELPKNGYQTEGFIEIHSYSTSNNLGISMYIIYKSISFSSETRARNRAIYLKEGSCLYINNGNALTNKVLLAMNNIPDGNCFGYEIDGEYYSAYLIHMDILRSRNKNIYNSDNHYLITGKI